MGVIWDLIQQGQISDRTARIEELERRVVTLEFELKATRQALDMVIEKMQERWGPTREQHHDATQIPHR
jgi:uncharacterized coiled-coil protein SlyX